MIIISDTTPILYLLKINELDLLHIMFDEIHIPSKVYEELTCNGRYQEEINILNTCKYIYVDDIVEYSKVRDLIADNENLHRGEAEAIVLCEQLATNLLFIEDNEAIEVAKRKGIKVIRLGQLLIELNRKGLKSKEEIVNIVEKLEKTKLKITERLYQYIISKLV